MCQYRSRLTDGQTYQPCSIKPEVNQVEEEAIIIKVGVSVYSNLSLRLPKTGLADDIPAGTCFMTLLYLQKSRGMHRHN